MVITDAGDIRSVNRVGILNKVGDSMKQNRRYHDTCDDMPSYCQILARQAEILKKSQYFYLSFQGHM